MKKFNRVNLSGRLAGYELNRGTTKNGDEFISGIISLIVDENGNTLVDEDGNYIVSREIDENS